MIIEKRALAPQNHARRLFPFPNARSGLKALLQLLNFDSKDLILLPSYIGWSPREGSGVFDPIRELGIGYAFYRLNACLEIDLDHVEQLLRMRPIRAVLIIHYFGYPDPGYADLVRLSKQHGAAVVEDEAHSFFSDFIGGVCGRLGHACIFSLHKMLPLSRGGWLELRDTMYPDAVGQPCPELDRVFHYDFCAISNRRRALAELWSRLLIGESESFQLLHPSLPQGVVPQTFPVILLRADRDRVFDEMNRLGFGVVSLYHTMITELPTDQFPDSSLVSRRILNLPVHQDTTEEAVSRMLPALEHCVRSYIRL